MVGTVRIISILTVVVGVVPTIPPAVSLPATVLIAVVVVSAIAHPALSACEVGLFSLRPHSVEHTSPQVSVDPPVRSRIPSNTQ